MKVPTGVNKNWPIGNTTYNALNFSHIYYLGNTQR